ncbi:MAG: hypothetical protein HYW24_00760 [Candidatus Aenigmarchaeota archaeon]|nr:hypothetical protein [Candidatus Aenigmarchaeota archaeon]
MVKNPFIILVELLFGLAQQTWDTITFSLSKLWELIISLSYYASQNLLLAIGSVIFGSIVAYFVFKRVFKEIPFKLIWYAIVAIAVLIAVVIIAGSMLYQ